MMQSGSRSQGPDWRTLGIAAACIGAIVGFIFAPVEAYVFIAMGMIISVTYLYD